MPAIDDLLLVNTDAPGIPNAVTLAEPGRDPVACAGLRRHLEALDAAFPADHRQTPLGFQR